MSHTAPDPPPPRVVLDTNLLIAAYFNPRSASHALLEEARAGRVRVLWSDAVRREATRILGNVVRAAGGAGRPALSLDDLYRAENRVSDPPPIRAVAEDPDDDKLLACAVGGGADLLVTNDRHLLQFQTFQGVAVVTPSEARKRLGHPAQDK